MKITTNPSEAPTDVASHSSAGKKPYSSPCLIGYGHVTALTNGGAVSVTSDSGQNMMRVTPSDEQLKTNIQKVGNHPAGFGLYLFDYKPEFQEFGKGRQFGVMAQEVEPIMPEAVSFSADGYRHVNYGMLGITLTKH